MAAVSYDVQAPAKAIRTAAALDLKAASLLRELRSGRAELLRNLEGLRLNAKRALRTTKSLTSQFTDAPSPADHQEAVRRLKTLSRRQREILGKVVAGVPNKMIAFELGVSEKTVETHRSRLMRKLGAGSLPDLVRIAFRARSVLPASDGA
jgi:DNA-binding NarL/FixJ family response regulator